MSLEEFYDNRINYIVESERFIMNKTLDKIIKKQLAYQPNAERVENPLEDMEIFQTQDVIDKVVAYVSKFAYNDECEVLYKKFDERMSIATIEQDKNEFIFIIFDKSDYWIEIRRKFVNQNNRKVTRRRKVNWIVCHSCICDQHVQVNVEKLFS